MCCDCPRVDIFFFNQKTAYEMRLSDWSSDVCSSDLSWPIATAAQSSEYGRRIAPPRCKNPALSEITVSGNADCPFCSASRRWQLPPAVPCPRQRTASQGKSGGAATGFSNRPHADRAQRPMGANGRRQLPPPPAHIAPPP